MASEAVAKRTLEGALAMARAAMPKSEGVTPSPRRVLVPDGTAIAGPVIVPRIMGKATPLDVVRGIEASHPVPADWEHRLRLMSPISDNVAWLTFGWLDWAKRWMLYECIPEKLIPAEKAHQLGGTPYWEMPKSVQMGRRQMVSAYQWEMYRRHRVWARPFWCLQGTEGGTPAKYSELETAILKAMGEPTDPPAGGDLPFAPFDGRAEKQLRARDRVWRMGLSLERLRMMGDSAQLKRETAEAEEQFRRTFLQWFKGVMEPGADFLAWYTRKTEADMVMRKAERGEVDAAAQLEESYIQHGVVPDAVSTQ